MLNRATAKAVVAALLVSTSGVSLAEEIVEGIDLDNVNWPLLCSQVEPIVFEQNGMRCEVSHPASKIHNTMVHQVVMERLPDFNNCEKLQEEYAQLITPKAEEGKEWKMCYAIFKSAIIDRAQHPERYRHDTKEWMDAYFNEDTMLEVQ